MPVAFQPTSDSQCPEQEQDCLTRLDRLEADMQHRLRCMSESGGMNIRDENTRRRKSAVTQSKKSFSFKSLILNLIGLMKNL